MAVAPGSRIGRRGALYRYKPYCPPAPSRFKRLPGACEHALGLDMAPEHRVSLKLNKRNFLSLQSRGVSFSDA
jgi:hypothetical protein